jgi:integrase
MGLTKTAVKAAEIKSERYWIWDESVPGLGLLVLPSGVKSWVLRYRTQAGQQRTHTLGRALELGPDEARRAALETLRQAREGRDPTKERATRRQNHAITALHDEFARLHYPLCKPGTVGNYKGYWKNHLLPRFGTRALATITEADIREFHSEYATRPILFNRCRDVLSMAFDLAIEKGWINHNPARAKQIKDYKERKRKRFLTEAEAPRLGRALEEYGQQSDMRWRFTSFITLLLVTGCRAREISHARWEWVDWEAKRINWPDTKTGRDDNVLPDLAIELLAELHRRCPGNPWIIAGARLGQPLVGYKKMWKEVCAKAQIQDLRVHDLRKSFASVALAEGLGLGVIAMLLRHANPNITADRYSFLMEETKRSAVNTAANAMAAKLRV